MNSVAYIELDGTEFEIPFKFSYHYDPGNISGPPEDCYPESEEFEWWPDGSVDHTQFNAMEWWELQHMDEDVFYNAAMVEMGAQEQAWAEYKWEMKRERWL